MPFHMNIAKSGAVHIAEKHMIFFFFLLQTNSLLTNNFVCTMVIADRWTADRLLTLVAANENETVSIELNAYICRMLFLSSCLQKKKKEQEQQHKKTKNSIGPGKQREERGETNVDIFHRIIIK